MQIASLTPSKFLFWFCIAFVVGIFIESIFNLPQILVCGFLLLGIILIFLGLLRQLRLPRNDEWVMFGFCVLVFAIGILRTQVAEFEISSNKLAKLNGKEKVELTGIIIAEPDERDNYQMLKIKIENEDSIVLATTNLYPKYNYLDKLKIYGQLQEPGNSDDSGGQSYKNYLAKSGIYSVMFYPKISVLEATAKHNLWQKIYSKILWFKSKIRQSIQYSFSPPESSILEGTILGDNGAMQDDLKTKLNATGLRHIIAVSGTHVVILSSIIMSLLIFLGLKRGDAFWFAIIFIALYVVFTGLPASGLRAGIMGGLYLIAQKLGRQSVGVRVVVLAGAVMLAFNPLLLLFDAGFQLSFLAVLGLIFLEPPLTAIIKVQVISTTFAAQIATLPLMVYSFGNVSLVAPITNLLVLPIIYWLMVFGFVSCFVGVFWNWLGWILSVPCYILLKYFLWVINFFSQSWAIKTFENVHWIWLAILYVPIIILTKYLNKKFSQKF